MCVLAWVKIQFVAAIHASKFSYFTQMTVFMLPPSLLSRAPTGTPNHFLSGCAEPHALKKLSFLAWLLSGLKELFTGLTGRRGNYCGVW